MRDGEFWMAMGDAVPPGLYHQANRRLGRAIEGYHAAFAAAVESPHDFKQARRLFDARERLADATAFAREFCLPIKEEER